MDNLHDLWFSVKEYLNAIVGTVVSILLGWVIRTFLANRLKELEKIKEQVETMKAQLMKLEDETLTRESADKMVATVRQEHRSMASDWQYSVDKLQTSINSVDKRIDGIYEILLHNKNSPN